MIGRLIGVIAGVSVTLPMTVGPVSAAPPEPGPRDITLTSAGQQAAEAAASRFRAMGVATDVADLAVYDLGSTGLLVGPKGGEVTVVSTFIGKRGELGFEVTVSEPLDDPALVQAGSTPSDFVPLAAPSWGLVGEACWDRTYWTQVAPLRQVWMDTCYHKHKLLNDGFSDRDFFELHMFATGASSAGKLKDMTILASKSSNSAAMMWHDWHPGADQNRSCQQITVGVSSPLPIGYGHQICDEWDITKFAEAGKFRNIYRAPLFFEPAFSEREVAFDIAVRVNQGATARWNFNWVAHWV